MNVDIALRLLRTAHHLIDTGEYYCICFALEAAENDDEDFLAGFDLREYVQARVFGYGWLGDWLHTQLGRYLSEEHRTLARLAWIDRMIYQLETTGTLP
jgi:hypothetical protein